MIKCSKAQQVREFAICISLHPSAILRYSLCICGSLWAFFAAISLMHCPALGAEAAAVFGAVATSGVAPMAKMSRRGKDRRVKGHWMRLHRKQPWPVVLICSDMFRWSQHPAPSCRFFTISWNRRMLVAGCKANPSHTATCCKFMQIELLGAETTHQLGNNKSSTKPRCSKVQKRSIAPVMVFVMSCFGHLSPLRAISDFLPLACKTQLTRFRMYEQPLLFPHIICS